MKILRLWSLLRREGLAGLAVRLRHPKSDHAAIRLAPLSGRVRVTAPDPRLAAQIETVLDDLGFDKPAADGAALQVIDSQNALADADAGGALLLTRTDIAESCARAAAAWALAHPGAAILVPTPAAMQALTQAGIAPGRIFVVPAQDRATLRQGLARWLIAAGALDPATAHPAWFPALTHLRPWSALCLSLPETPARRAAFQTSAPDGFTLFDGVRLNPGWTGCAFSYRLIARAALARDAVPLIVCEDDAILPADLTAELEVTQNYLQRVEWDVFSGLVTNLSDRDRTPSATQFCDRTFVHLSDTIGMVFNIYNRRALEWLADWTPKAGGIAGNSIDAV